MSSNSNYDYSDFNADAVLSSESRLNTIAATFMKNVYLWMAMALSISGLTAYAVAMSPEVYNIVLGNKVVFWVFMLTPIILVWIISACIDRLSFPAATILYFVYSILMGVFLSSIFVIFTSESIASTFFVTAGTFGVTSLYGYFTKRDLSTWKNFLMMGLIGLIIASIVNIFMQSELVYWISTYVGVIVFVGLTAYDTKKLKQLALNCDDADTDNSKKVALLCALSLYLDFVNLLLYLLRIFGRKK